MFIKHNSVRLVSYINCLFGCIVLVLQLVFVHVAFLIVDHTYRHKTHSFVTNNY